MKIEKCRVGQNMINKVTKKLYVVTEIGEGSVTLNEASYDGVTTTLIEGTVPVTVTAANAYCYRMVYDPNPPREIKLEDYEIKNGVLYFDQAPVVMGSITALDLIGVINGRYLAFIGTKDGIRALYTYSAKKDSFVQQTEITGDYSVNSIDGAVVILNSNKQLCKDEDREYSTSDGTNVIVCTSSSVREFFTDKIYADPDNPAIRIVNDTVYVGSGYIINDNREIINEGYRYFVITPSERRIVETETVALAYPIYPEGSLLMTKNAIYTATSKYTLPTSELGKYVYLIDLKEESPTKDVLVFADIESTGIRTLTYDYLDDRGVVYNIA